MKYTIQKTKDGSFESNGEMISYFWYRALDPKGTLVEFGSPKEYEKGQVVDLELLKSEDSKGRVRLKEASDKGWD